MKSGYDYLEEAALEVYFNAVQQQLDKLRVNQALLEAAYPLTSWFVHEGHLLYFPKF